ncbi:hypothetical protein FRACYDRAFT_177848 [Fragilariopsis cylindrus CCMP1102]|uniref:Helicase-associated domain-containing protein n=1 Tax=Fragilariopsis cylindrus CCMP1102 TaxID=635003 RepID=A0A1E7FVK4_9STRA|nr:hypothetical protein FRACYDRAFT_177848 [Fragilariopsis cylindrus CCMP1102]|eukprot:OEU22157.1 hypothetical protein FRACYDRAFT_177848 [Fragilariopsis cylindrus CCMP1102]
MRVRTDTNNSLISILVEKKRIRHTYPANRAQRVQRSTNPTRSTTTFDLQWQSRYHELKEYNTLNKHTNVPKDYTRNPQLGRWVNTQRTQYNLLLNGKESGLTTERINLLDAIGFAWSSDMMTIKWQLMYAELVEYEIVNRDTNVPFDYTRNPQLGRWVNTQRTQYKLWLHKGKSDMTPERINLLDAIGFRWRMKREIIPIDVDTSTTDDGTSTTTNNSNDDDGDRKPAAVW